MIPDDPDHRIVCVFHNMRMGETENHPVQVSVQIPGSNQMTSTYLSHAEALDLYRSLEMYLHVHAPDPRESKG